MARQPCHLRASREQWPGRLSTLSGICQCPGGGLTYCLAGTGLCTSSVNLAPGSAAEYTTISGVRAR